MMQIVLPEDRENVNDENLWSVNTFISHANGSIDNAVRLLVGSNVSMLLRKIKMANT